MKIVYQTPYVKICLDETLPVVYEEWLGRVSGKEFKLALQEKLNVYTKYKQEYDQLFWMNDVRKLTGIRNEELQWAVNEFHPKLYTAGVRKIAFVVPEHTYARLSDEEILGKFDARNEVKLCYFDDFESAFAWFKENQNEPQVS